MILIKEELAKLDQEFDLINQSSLASSEDSEKYERISEQYEQTKSKMHALKLKVAKKNREISSLKRKTDEIPSRIELTQYQKRFIELYNQS